VALIASAIACRDSRDLPIVGIDIAGAERGFPAHTHAEAFRQAHKRFLNKTVHAGESYGPESIFEALADLHAERIGHGYNLFAVDKIDPKHNLEGLSPEQYVAELVQYVAEHGARFSTRSFTRG
jgi:adenosine deaminase